VGSGAVATTINPAAIDGPATLAELNPAIPIGRMARLKEIAV
jgi:hypothetical protein